MEIRSAKGRDEIIHVRTIPGLISCVFDDNIGLVVLEVSQRQEDDISLVNPDLQSGAWRQSSSLRRYAQSTDLFPHLSADVR